MLPAFPLDGGRLMVAWLLLCGVPQKATAEITVLSSVLVAAAVSLLAYWFVPVPFVWMWALLLSGGILCETQALWRQLKDKTLLEVMRYAYPPETRLALEVPRMAEVAPHWEAQEGQREVRVEVAEGPQLPGVAEQAHDGDHEEDQREEEHVVLPE